MTSNSLHAAPQEEQVPSAGSFAFPEGIIGFPEIDRFSILPSQRDGLYWLQAVHAEPLTFLAMDPFLFVNDYFVDLGPDELGVLMIEDPSRLIVLSIVTLPKTHGGHATTNLQGPIVLNVFKGLGKQIVVQDSEYGVRCPVELWRGQVY